MGFGSTTCQLLLILDAQAYRRTRMLRPGIIILRHRRGPCRMSQNHQRSHLTSAKGPSDENRSPGRRLRQQPARLRPGHPIPMTGPSASWGRNTVWTVAGRQRISRVAGILARQGSNSRPEAAPAGLEASQSEIAALAVVATETSAPSSASPAPAAYAVTSAAGRGRRWGLARTGKAVAQGRGRRGTGGQDRGRRESGIRLLPMYIGIRLRAGGQKRRVGWTVGSARRRHGRIEDCGLRVRRLRALPRVTAGGAAGRSSRRRQRPTGSMTSP